MRIAFDNATISWSSKPSSSSTNSPASSISDNTGLESDVFIIKDINAHFPNDKLSLICGATGAGKSLLLLSLLGETVVLEGSVECPRAPVTEDVSFDFSIPNFISEEDWILDHSLAYVSQTGEIIIVIKIIFGDTVKANYHFLYYYYYYYSLAPKCIYS